MKTIEAALSAAPSMSIPEIEAEMHARDRQVVALRAEMAQLHPYWERKQLAKQAASMAANPSLAQRLDAGFDLGSLNEAQAETLLAQLIARKKGGK